MLACGNCGYTGEKFAELRLPAAEGGRALTRLCGRSIISIAAVACVCAILSIEYRDVGVDVPGVMITDPVLLEATEGARSILFMLLEVAADGMAGDIVLRLGGETGRRGPAPGLAVLSMSGVRRREGGRKGENA
jgi:hypothetical protein